MSYVFDASVIVRLLVERGSRLLDELRAIKIMITDLCVYEANNALWKMATLTGIMGLEDAMQASRAMSMLISAGLLKLIRFDDIDLSTALRLAYDERITFYDASYIAVSMRAGATLTSGDTKLIAVAKRYVPTITYNELIMALGNSDIWTLY